MKMLLLATLVLCAFSPTAVAAGIDGRWTSVREVGAADGKTYSHTTTFTLKNDGGVLTGTVVQSSAAPWMKGMNGGSLEISEGKVDGDKFSFKVKLDTGQGESTAIFEGTIEGDQLKGTTKYRGIGITQPFEAKRTDSH
jgi:hypothetical protein